MIIASELSDSELTMESCRQPRSLATCVSSYSPVPLNNTEDLQTWLRRGFPVSPSASPESSEAQTMTATCGRPQSQPLMLFDQDTASLKTLQLSLIADTSESSSETWLRAGIVSGGEFYQQPNWERRISEIGCGLLPTPKALDSKDRSGQDNPIVNGRVVRPSGQDFSVSLATMAGRDLWPTPRSQDAKHGAATEWELQSGRGNLHIAVAKAMWPTPSASDGTGGPGNSGREGGLNLRTAVRQWPTPCAHEARLGYQDRSNGKAGTQKSLTTEVIDDLGGRDQVGGQLSPDWTEWLMSWPIGWTSLDPLPQSAVDEWADKVRSGEWWANEPNIPRVAKGVPNRTHRLKAIGNGQASPVVAMAWKLLTEG